MSGHRIASSIAVPAGFAAGAIAVFVPQIQATIEVDTEGKCVQAYLPCPSDDNITVKFETTEKGPSVFLPEVLQAAKERYATLYEKEFDPVTEALIGRTYLWSRRMIRR